MGERLGWFDIEAIATWANMTIAAVAASIGALRRRAILRSIPGVPDAYAFADRLTEYHLTVGTWAGTADREDQVVEEAWHDRDELLNQQARLAKLALSAGRWELAVHQAHAGLATWRPVAGHAVKARLLRVKSVALESQREFAEALATAEAAAAEFESIGNLESAARERMRAVEIRSRLWARASAFSEVEPDSGESVEDGVGHHDWLAARGDAALVAMRALRHEDAIRLARSVLSRPESTVPRETWLSATLADADSRAHIAPTLEAIDRLEAVGQMAKAHRLNDAVASAAVFSMVLLGEFHADFARVREIGVAAIAALEDQGDSKGAALVQTQLAFTACDQGDLKGAGHALNLVGTLDLRTGPVPYSGLADLYVKRYEGSFGEVLRAVEAMDLSFARNAPDVLIFVADVAAFAALGAGFDLSGDVLEIVALALAAGDGDRGADSWKLHLFVAAVEGDVAPGGVVWRERLRGLAACGGPTVEIFCHLADGFVAGRDGDAAAADAAFRTAATGFERLGVGWWAARAWLAAGEVGVVDEAAECLERARTLFGDMGAGGWRERAEDRLRSLGRRWVSQSSGPLGLSGRELDVLREVRVGRTNAQVAERLVLSENTVARHLTRIYAKLGVAGRAEALAAVDGVLGDDGNIS